MSHDLIWQLDRRLISLCGWWLHVMTLSSLVSTKLVRLEIKRFSFVTWLQMVTWSKNLATFWVVTPHTSYWVCSDKHRGSKDIRNSFVTWTHVTTWSKEYVALWLDIWLLIISHHSAKFDSGRSWESKFITLFICHVTLYDHMINGL